MVQETQRERNRTSTSILDRADLMIVHLQSFGIVVFIDTRMRKRFNLRVCPRFEEIIGGRCQTGFS